MPGILEDIALSQQAVAKALADLTEEVRANARPLCPMLPDEEVWSDGPLTVEEAALFLKISEAKVAHLVRDGKLVSMKDGRRLIAKRGCIRYLLAHQEHAHAEAR